MQPSQTINFLACIGFITIICFALWATISIMQFVYTIVGSSISSYKEMKSAQRNLPYIERMYEGKCKENAELMAKIAELSAPSKP